MVGIIIKKYIVTYSNDATHGVRRERTFTEVEARNKFMNEVRQSPNGHIYGVKTQDMKVKTGRG
jgi:hypothetical protein